MKIVMFALLLSAHCELTTALNKTHFYITNLTSWTDAQTYCRTFYVDLSTVDSQEEITALNALSGGALTGSAVSWVGLKLNSTNNWQWSDGSNSSLLWKPGQPHNSAGDFCAGLNTHGLDDRPCTDKYNFFCYKWDSELIELTVSELIELTVSELIVVKENKSWEDALEYCRTHHTDLASLPTNLHLNQAKQITAETSSVWTGLRFLAGSWFWLSDEDLGYLTVQLPACPANYTYCGSLNLKNQSWENRNCMEELNFVCY